MSKKGFLAGTFILTSAGILTRIIGFFYRIFLSQVIGAQGLGLFQLVMPVQMLILSITTTGMQMAISRLCASHLALGEGKRSRDLFLLGTSFSVCFTLLLSLLLYHKGNMIAEVFLKNAKAGLLLRMYAFSLPLSSLHACITGYYFSRKKTGLPAGTQLLEQLVRTGSTWVLCQVLLREGKQITPLIAVCGSFFGELAACLVSLLVLGLHFHTVHYRLFSRSFLRSGSILPAASAIRKGCRELFSTALPLSLNRILLTLLGSMEVILIPQRLQMSGLSPEEALAVYGIFTGMAMPLILFPSTITNSASVMLMPSIAQLQALGYKKRIRYVVEQACAGCFFLGAVCTLFFYLSGNFLGSFLFHNETAGIYIKTLSFICPFVYVHTTLTGILNGLGRSGICLLHNLISLIVRITFVVAAIPALGIRGYLYGLLFSDILLTIIHLRELWRIINMQNSIDI